jgi:CRISPR system Cascade subunit CasE
MHRLVMSGFYGWTEPTEKDPRALMGILDTWRLDLRESQLVIVIQSRVQPDWSRIPRGALTQNVTTLHVDLRIALGANYTFRTVVNPVRERDAVKDTPNGPQRIHTRLADTTPKHVREWFAERLQPLDTPEIGERGVRRIGADGNPDKMTVKMLPKLAFNDRHKGKKLGRAEIAGSLTVTNPETFVQSLANGIGRSRAYSSGLLLIREALIHNDGTPGQS